MGRSTEKHLAMHTSKPATFSINIHLGAHPCFARSGNTCSMRWRKELALGSSAPLAPGLRTVYGWQDGESNQIDASSSRSSKASRVEISVCLDKHKVISLKKKDLEYLLDYPLAVIRIVYATSELVPVESAYNLCINIATLQRAMQSTFSYPLGLLCCIEAM